MNAHLSERSEIFRLEAQLHEVRIVHGMHIQAKQLFQYRIILLQRIKYLDAESPCRMILPVVPVILAYR